jgi:5-hydroxyisourate hydrolase-like protein (transthyretin family)
VGDTTWTWLSPVSTDATGRKYARVTLPITGMAAGTYQFYFDVRDCNGQRTYSRLYYFKVE